MSKARENSLLACLPRQPRCGRKGTDAGHQLESAGGAENAENATYAASMRGYKYTFSLHPCLHFFERHEVVGSRGWQTFLVGGQTVNSLGFAGHVSCGGGAAAATQMSHMTVATALTPKTSSGWGSVPGPILPPTGKSAQGGLAGISTYRDAIRM